VGTFEQEMERLTADDEPPLEDVTPEPPIGVIMPGDGDEGDDGAEEDRTLPVDAETRGVDGSVTAAAEHLEGLAVRFGSASLELRSPGGATFREQFEEGAFAESLAVDDVRVQWQHDASCVFGRVSAGTARVWEEEGEGLRYTADPPDAQWARDAMASVRRGDVTQNSFTFRVQPGGERWERREGVLHRVISKAKLFEVGPQTTPAYPDTSVAVRSMEAFLAATDAAPEPSHMDLLRRRARLAGLPS
jgi:hypothetical protein